MTKTGELSPGLPGSDATFEEADGDRLIDRVRDICSGRSEESGVHNLCGGGDKGDAKEGGDSELTLDLGESMITMGLCVLRRDKGLDTGNF